MFFPIVLTLFLSTYTCAQQCPNNITTCASIYHKKIITPLGIDCVSLARLRSTIRYYNYYYKLNNNPGRNKRQRRKFRMNAARNYNFYSYSKELDYLQHICDINYEKIDIQKIRYKYRYAVKYSQHARFKHEFNGFFVMFIMFFLVFLLTFLFTFS